MPDPLKAVKAVNTEIDKAMDESAKKLKDFVEAAKQISPRNRLAREKLIVLVGKLRTQVVQDKAALFEGLRALREGSDNISWAQSEFENVREGLQGAFISACEGRRPRAG